MSAEYLIVFCSIDNIKNTENNSDLCNKLKELDRLLSPFQFLNSDTTKPVTFLSTMYGQIVVIDSSVSVQSTLTRISEFIDNIRAGWLSIRVAVTKGSLKEVNDVDGTKNYIGQAINDAARVISSRINDALHDSNFLTESLPHHLYILNEKFSDEFLSQPPFQQCTKPQKKFVGKHYAEEFSCSVLEIKPVLEKRPPYTQIPLEGQFFFLTYDLKGFSASTIEEMPDRFGDLNSEVSNAWKEYFSNEQDPANVLSPIILGGGDGGAIVLPKPISVNTALDFSRYLWKRLYMRKSSVQCRMCLHEGEVNFRTSLQGDKKPYGKSFYNVEAILDSNIVRIRDGLALTSMIVGHFRNSELYPAKLFEVIPKSESLPEFYIDKQTILHDISRDLEDTRLLMLVEGGYPDTNKHSNIAADHLVPYGEAKDIVPKGIQRIFGRSAQLLEAVPHDVPFDETEERPSHLFTIITVAGKIDGFDSQEALNNPDRINSELTYKDKYISLYTKTLNHLLNLEYKPSIICFNEHTFPRVLKDQIDSKQAIVVTGSYHDDDGDYKTGHQVNYVLHGDQRIEHPRLTTANPYGKDHTSIPSQRQIKIYRYRFSIDPNPPMISKDAPDKTIPIAQLNFTILQGRDVLDPSLILQIISKNHSPQISNEEGSNDESIQLVFVPVYQEAQRGWGSHRRTEKTFIEACQDLSLLARCVVILVNLHAIDRRQHCFVAGETVPETISRKDKQSHPGWKPKNDGWHMYRIESMDLCDLELPAKGIQRHTLDLKVILEYLEALSKFQPPIFRDIKYFFSLTSNEGDTKQGDRRNKMRVT